MGELCYSIGVMKRSKLFWTLLIVSSVYFSARECAYLTLFAGWWDPGSEATTWLGSDLRIYVDAAQSLLAREDIYYSGDPPKFEVYNYTPFHALVLSQFVKRLPFNTLAFVYSLISLMAYAALFFTWRRLFPLLGLVRASEMMIGLLPLWLIYPGWWGDATYLNVFVMLALTASWLFYFIWQRRLLPSALLLIFILQVKPHWMFGLALPLLLGRFRFFMKLLGLVALGYVLIASLTVIWLGPEYGLAQYYAYYEMLSTHHLEIPWHGPGEYIGYDHSIAQIYFHLFGYQREAWPVVRLIKLILLAPFGVVAVRLMQRNRQHPELVNSGMALESFFVLYFAAFIWLDLVWEITLSIVPFIYLMTVLQDRPERWLSVVPFGWYAISDLWLTIGIPLSAVASGSAEVAKHGPPWWADPSFHIPIIMFVILTFYGVLTRRLFQRTQYGPVLYETVLRS
jgi:hypothetical protein